jgi:F0F1-type ATP synthase membrane subunit b/b'
MTRRLLTLFVLAAAVLAIALPAQAQTPDEVAAQVRDQGYWIDPALSVDPARISSAVAQAGNAGVRLMVVLLDGDPSGGATTFADAVLDRIGSGTVLVLSANDEGIASTDFDQDTLGRALDAGYNAGGGDAGYVEAAAAVLAGTPITTATTSGSSSTASSGSHTGLIVLLVILAVLVGLVVWAVRHQGKATAQSRQRAVEEARKEIKAQLDAMANTILEISDKVSASESREDNQYLQQASQTFTEATDAYEKATDPAKLEEISSRLDEARWQLDAAAAVADGKPLPPKPTPEERHACFFDPTHPGPFEDAEVRTAAGTKTVRVCAACAEKLRHGEQPQPRMIQVNGQEVPAATAPRSYGGGGLNWLDVFAVLVGGMGQARSYNWGRPTTSSGGFGWGWGSSSRGSSGSVSHRTPSGFGGGGGFRARAGRTRSRRR